MQQKPTVVRQPHWLTAGLLTVGLMSAGQAFCSAADVSSPTPEAIAAASPEQAPIVRHLSEAIRYQTVSHQDKSKIDYPTFHAFQEFLRGSYPRAFAQLQPTVIADYSLLLSWPGKDTQLQPVLFDSHYDVVPVEPGTEQDWQQPPFAGVVADGYLWGRGTLDDKVSVIATLEAIEQLLADGYEPERSLLFSFAHDEEIGGNEGAANIAAHLKQQGTQLAYMIGEGGLVLEDNPLVADRSMAMISLAEKTYVTLTLKAKGEGGHSSNPTENNAAVNLAKAVTALHENPFKPELVPPVSNMVETLGQQSGGVQGFMMRNQWLSKTLLAYVMDLDRTSRMLVRNTTAVTMFNAGVKENVIPQTAEAKVNFRLLPGFTPEHLLESVKEIIDDPSITIDAKSWKPGPKVADVNGLGFQRIEAAIQRVLPDTLVTPGLLTASSDTPHYIDLTDNIYRFHPFTTSMVGSQAIHGTDERISLDALHNAVRLSQALIESVAAE